MLPLVLLSSYCEVKVFGLAEQMRCQSNMLNCIYNILLPNEIRKASLKTPGTLK